MMNNPWFKCFQPNPQATLRLFCFPYAGGGASLFRLWPKSLPSNVELWAIQLPGRENRLKETAFTQLSALIPLLLQQMRPYLDKPFAFFGHSMGAVISFSLVQQLRYRQQPTPAHLFVSGRRAPHLPNPRPPICHLPDADFIKVVERRYQGIPRAVLQNAELMALFLPLLRADFGLIETHTYISVPPLNCPITAFGGFQDKLVNRQELEAWADQTQAPFTLKMLPGDHFYLTEATTSAALLRIISQSLLTIL